MSLLELRLSSSRGWLVDLGEAELNLVSKLKSEDREEERNFLCMLNTQMP